MSTVKVINHLSIDSLNMDEILSVQGKSFVNDDAVLIPNGSIQRIPIFDVKEIYQMVEPRLVLVMEAVPRYVSICRITT